MRNNIVSESVQPEHVWSSECQGLIEGVVRWQELARGAELPAVLLQRGEDVQVCLRRARTWDVGNRSLVTPSACRVKS
eukprot:2461909-Rhodomonas_salina.2